MALGLSRRSASISDHWQWAGRSSGDPAEIICFSTAFLVISLQVA